MKTLLRLFLSLILVISATYLAAAETLWINNITVSEYNITWGYTETFTGMDSMSYRINIDTELGDNDSFVNAWELLKADKEVRKKFKSSIENEFDIRINNETSGIELINVDSSLSQSIIGKTHVTDTIENRYNVTYRLKKSIFNASSIWFLGEPKSPVSIILPAGIDVVNISGMDNMAKNIDSHAEVTGFFSRQSPERGEITISIAKNASYSINYSKNNITEVNTTEKNENMTKPASEISKKINEWSIIGIGIIFIVLIYVFKVRKR
jgi:hypothetical protein